MLMQLCFLIFKIILIICFGTGINIYILYIIELSESSPIK